MGARVTFTDGNSPTVIDTVSPALNYGTIVSYDSERIIYSDEVVTTYYEGEFTFEEDVLVEGTVTYMRCVANGDIDFIVTRNEVFPGDTFNVDAVTFFNYLGAGNTNGAMAFMLAGGDLLSATSVGIDHRLKGYAGPDTIHGGFGNDLMIGNDGDDSITGAYGDDTMIGGMGNDTLLGGFDKDWLRGNRGNDLLWGDHPWFGNGRDTLVGGAGNDELAGFQRIDRLIGGDGEDTFIVRFFTPDKILDFNAADDRIGIAWFHTAFFEGLERGRLSPDVFYSGPGAVEAEEADDRIVYNTLTGRVYLDIDGVGEKEPKPILDLRGQPDLTAENFFVFFDESYVVPDFGYSNGPITA